MHTRWPGSGVPFGPIRGPRARTRPGFLRPIATGILVERPTAANGGCDEEWPLCEDLPVAVTLIPRSRESRRGCGKPARPPCGTRFLHKSAPDTISEKPRVPRPASRVPHHLELLPLGDALRTRCHGDVARLGAAQVGLGLADLRLERVDRLRHRFDRLELVGVDLVHGGVDVVEGLSLI